MSLAAVPTVDERWLAFVERTRRVFAVHPHLLPLRQQVFKEIVERKTRLTLADRAKGWARPVLKREASAGQTAPVDVVFWVNSSREVLTEALLPVLQQVTAQGVSAALIAPARVYDQLGDVPACKILLRIPAARQPQKPWAQAWDDLRACLGADLPAASRTAFMQMGAHSADCVREAARLLAALKPRLLVLPVDQLLPDSAACVAAHQLGIESLVLLHGAVSPYNAPLTAGTMGVWGPVSHEQMMAFGVPNSQLVILGSPRHDRFGQTPVDDAGARFRAALGLPDSPLLVFFSNGNDPRRNSYEAVTGCAEWLEQAAAKLAGQITIAVRLHPNEDGHFYEGCSHLRVFKNEADLALTLTAADVCAALCSTTLVDALLYGRPVLQFYAEGWPNLADNWRRGLAQRIGTPQDLTAFLSAARSEWRALAAEQKALLPQVFAHHGRAAAVVADYVVQQVRS